MRRGVCVCVCVVVGRGESGGGGGGGNWIKPGRLIKLSNGRSGFRAGRPA